MVTKRETNKREELLKLLYRAIYVLAFAFCLFKIYDYKHPYFGHSLKIRQPISCNSLPSLKRLESIFKRAPAMTANYTPSF